MPGSRRPAYPFLLACLLASGPASALDDPPPPAAAPAAEASRAEDPAPKKEPAESAYATFGGGCFWSMEAIFERIPGVRSVTPGYAGGRVPNPTYQMVLGGSTGHAEVVQIEYDPDATSYEKLLRVFWAAHDPTTLNRQGDDFGTNYRSIILHHDDEQKAAALASYQELTAARRFRRPIVTQLAPLDEFYPAEPYHQDYYRRHRGAIYCRTHIVPKLRKLKLPL